MFLQSNSFMKRNSLLIKMNISIRTMHRFSTLRQTFNAVGNKMANGAPFVNSKGMAHISKREDKVLKVLERVDMKESSEEYKKVYNDYIKQLNGIDGNHYAFGLIDRLTGKITDLLGHFTTKNSVKKDSKGNPEKQVLVDEKLNMDGTQASAQGQGAVLKHCIVDETVNLKYNIHKQGTDYINDFPRLQKIEEGLKDPTLPSVDLTKKSQSTSDTPSDGINKSN